MVRTVEKILTPSKTVVHLGEWNLFDLGICDVEPPDDFPYGLVVLFAFEVVVEVPRRRHPEIPRGDLANRKTIDRRLLGSERQEVRELPSGVVRSTSIQRDISSDLDILYGQPTEPWRWNKSRIDSMVRERRYSVKP